MKRPARKRYTRHAHMRTATHVDQLPAQDAMFEIRRSRIHGRGAYALKAISRGTRIVEYLGERISHTEADARYTARGDDDGHTFLFVVDDDTCIDAGVDGNDARFINHSCDPNCATEIDGGRVFIDALRDIAPGEELGYDYSLTWVSTDDPAELALYACRCGSPRCRGTMLDSEALDQKARKAGKRTRPRNTRRRRTMPGRRRSR